MKTRKNYNYYETALLGKSSFYELMVTAKVAVTDTKIRDLNRPHTVLIIYTLKPPNKHKPYQTNKKTQTQNNDKTHTHQ